MQVQVLGMDCVDMTGSILISFEGRKILFNCGEGLQRLSIEHKLKLAKLEMIFISKLDWRHTGGLPGLLLTVSDVGVRQITVVGPKGTSIFFSMMVPFFQRKGFRLVIEEVDFGSLASFTTSNGVSIDCISSITDTQQKDFSEDLHIAKKILSRMFMAGLPYEQHSYPNVENLPVPNYESISFLNEETIQFVIRTPQLPGKFDPVQATKYSIPKGPLFGQLKMGNSVVLPSGETIHPEMCVGPKYESKTFFYLEFENQSETNKFSLFLDKYRNSISNIQFALVKSCLKEDIDFLRHFIPKVYLIPTKLPIEFPDFGPLIFLSTSKVQDAMSQVTNSLHFTSCYYEDLKDKKVSGYYEPCLPFHDFIVSPTKEGFYYGLAENSAIECNEDESKCSQRTGDFLLEHYSLHGTINSEFFKPKDDFIVFLGTGSALPSMYRNVSSFLVGFPDQNSFYLFDCGEGTFGQLCRKFGPYARHICRNLKGIFLSHLHADHHLGTMKFLQQNINENNQIDIYAPPCLHSWFSGYSKIDSSISQSFSLYSLIPNQPIHFKNSALSVIIPIPVRHCPESFGFVAFFNPSTPNSALFKLSYSGDTLPCPDFNNAALNSDIFIHEATFDDSLVEEAALRQHSTITQAIESFQASYSKFAILTHFSQRYPKFPEFVASNGNVALAFDGMHAALTSLSSLNEYLPSLKTYFTAAEQ